MENSILIQVQGRIHTAIQTHKTFIVLQARSGRCTSVCGQEIDSLIYDAVPITYWVRHRKLKDQVTFTYNGHNGLCA